MLRIVWLALILIVPSAASEVLSCTPFECYQQALDQLKYARELIEAQQVNNQKLLEEIRELAENNKQLILQNKKLISALQQKTELINSIETNELNINGTVSADVFKSNIKEFSPYNTVEPDSADKDFYEDNSCTFGTITSALVNNQDSSNLQAAICTCLHSKRGRGWFCWN